MNFKIKDVENNEYDVSNVLSYEINKSVYIPCDSLNISFLNPVITTEIKEIYAYNNGDIIFKGVVDKQICSFNKKGLISSISARNTAALLVDNESVPGTYILPNTKSIFFNHCEKFGFKNKLPDFFLDGEYIVPKGISNWGAISNFIRGISGEKIYVNNNDEICIFEPSKNIAVINEKNDIISAKLIYNRSQPVSKIKYKIGDNNYIFTAENKELIKKDILRSRSINISSFPLWKQKDIIKNIFRSSIKNYNFLEICLAGSVNFNLYDSVDFSHNRLGSFDNQCIKEIAYIFDKNGEKTELVLSEDRQIKEEFYVDK